MTYLLLRCLTKEGHPQWTLFLLKLINKINITCLTFVKFYFILFLFVLRLFYNDTSWSLNFRRFFLRKFRLTMHSKFQLFTSLSSILVFTAAVPERAEADLALLNKHYLIITNDWRRGLLVDRPPGLQAEVRGGEGQGRGWRHLCLRRHREVSGKWHSGIYYNFISCSKSVRNFKFW